MENLNLDYYEIPIQNKFALNAMKKLGQGDFGKVYVGRDLISKKNVAIKLENNNKQTLFFESKIYITLNHIKRIPKLHWVGTQGRYNILVIDLLGDTIKKLMNFCGGKLSLASTLKISTQILSILEQIHSSSIILRYITPRNMAIGLGDNSDYIYLFDFGLCKKYRNMENHIPYRENKDVEGNRKFISIRVHNGIEVSRRDDIESLGYNIIYFMKGELPWSHIKNSNQILLKKTETSLDELCQGLPEEFKLFIKYSRELEFTERPDYSYLNNLLLKAAEKNNIDLQKVKYDWVLKKEKMEEEEKLKKEEKNKKEKEENKQKQKDDEKVNEIKNNEQNKEIFVDEEQKEKKEINEKQQDIKEEEKNKKENKENLENKVMINKENDQINKIEVNYNKINKYEEENKMINKIEKMNINEEEKDKNN